MIYLDHTKSSKTITSSFNLKSESFTVFFIDEENVTRRTFIYTYDSCQNIKETRCITDCENVRREIVYRLDSVRVTSKVT